MPDVFGIARELAALRSDLGARAAGAWRVGSGRLDQSAFDAAEDMPAEVVAGFRAATEAVSLDRLDLGVVEAAVRGRRTVSLASALPAGAGSGFWLRAFGADRSVAVPIVADGGVTVGVVSVALADFGLTDDAVEARLRQAAALWFSAV